MSQPLTLKLLAEDYAILGYQLGTPLPDWARPENVLQMSRAANELTIVTEIAHLSAADAAVADAWRAFQVIDTFDFTVPGILASVLTPLAEAGIGIFAFSTFSTDCVLVQASDLDAALAALARASHRVVDAYARPGG